MFSGEHINRTENRSVLHNVVPDVFNVLDKIMEFSEKVLSGSSWGASCWSYLKPPKDMFAIGIDASFLGPLFVHLALQTDPQAVEFAKGRHLCFVKKEEEMDQLDKLVKKFGIDPNDAFAFWDWVGGHYSVSTLKKQMIPCLQLQAEKIAPAINILPSPYNSIISRQSVLNSQPRHQRKLWFLMGTSSIDQHFHSAPFKNNILYLIQEFRLCAN
uniref:Uncharacterized protein n=1 Tax=Gossypium raimondii TaxID=29730 RepID=A0A0D2UQW5_GOSRA|nr:hypothetical protein B456_009G203000 [Gossypium raimondii]